MSSGYIALGLGGLSNPMTASGDMIYGGTAGIATRLPKGTDGQVLALASGIPTWSTISGTGSVTSVDVSVPAALLTISGNPITTSGTLAFGLASQSGNKVLASPANGSSGAWAARVLVGADLPLPAAATLGGVFSKAAVATQFLTSISAIDGSVGQAQPAFTDISGTASTGQIPNLSATYSVVAGNASIATVGTVTSGTWSATTIALNKGGTGQTTKAAAFDALSPMSASGDIVYGGASGTGTRLAKGTDGQFLKLVSGVPAWAAGGGVSNSTVQLSAVSGKGSTGSCVIGIWTNNSTTGTDLTYATSATLGDTVTVNTTGQYSISCSFAYSNNGTSGARWGLSLNQADVTTFIGSLPAANLAGPMSACCIGTNPSVISITRWLTAGDVIRLNISTAYTTENNTNCFFLMTRVQ